MQKRTNSLLFHFAVIFLIFTVVTLTMSGINTYVRQNEIYKAQCEENIRHIGEYLADLILEDGDDFVIYQEYYMNDVRMMDILDCACENDLAVVVHAGFDVGLPGLDFSVPEYVLPVIEKLHPKKLVLAHMGGWRCWDEVEELLAGKDVYFDTSFSIVPLRDKDAVLTASFPPSSDPSINRARTKEEQLSIAQFLRITKKHGKEKLLFGSDSPWSPQKESVSYIKNSGLPDDFLDAIFYKNAEKLLK